MALVYTLIKRGHLIGGLEAILMDILFDSSYPTGGELIDNSSVGLPAILAAIDTRSGVSDGPYNFKYNKATGKMQVFRSGSGPIEVYSPGGGDIKGSVSADVGIASGALPTNGQLWSTLADAANTTAFTIALQPDVGRNVSISLKNTVAGASTGNAVTFTIVGTFRGAAQTDTVAFTALELTSTAQNEVATKHSVKPFDSVTSITPSAAQPASWQHAAGPGSKIGLPNATATNAEADLIKLTKNGANLAITGLYSTNQTVDFGILADGDDISIEYLGSGGFVELNSAFDLSATTMRALFLG
jgi:hypothetical protein